MSYFLLIFFRVFLIYCFYNNDLVANFVHCKAGNFSGLSREFHRHEQGICKVMNKAPIGRILRRAHRLIILVKNNQGGRDQATLLGVGP
jgi:hypothetical protein